MLTDKQREKLAHFMEWEKEVRLDCPACWVMPDGDPVMVCDVWLNPLNWSHAGMLLDKLFTGDTWASIGRLDIGGFACELECDREQITWQRGSTAPEAVACAVLAMLEAVIKEGDGDG